MEIFLLKRVTGLQVKNITMHDSLEQFRKFGNVLCKLSARFTLVRCKRLLPFHD